MGFSDSRLNATIVTQDLDKCNEVTGEGLRQSSAVTLGTATASAKYESDIGGRPDSAGPIFRSGTTQSDLGGGDRIAIIENRMFLRECIRRGLQPAFSLPLDTYGSIAELEIDNRLKTTRLVIILWSSEVPRHENETLVVALSQLLPGAPIVVLAHPMNPEQARGAIAVGARGYIPMNMGFDLAVEVVRFTLAGGTYVPHEYLLAESGASPKRVRAADNVFITAREMSVLRAIQKGKPNKVIAYELNMCESTVKVHVRHIMKKLGARNRTAVAMKASEIMSLARSGS